MRTDEQKTPPTVCRCLRTKMAFGTVVGEDPWQLGEDPTHVYWCLASMEPVGPDEGLAHPHHCQKGRGCFQAPVE